MKNILLLLTFITCVTAAQAQQFVARTGHVHFFSSTPMENIEATTTMAVCALNTVNKKLVVKIKNKSFKFKDGLMQDHFNENYMESDKYEFSTLEGVIEEAIDFTKDGEYDVTIKGTLDIHGVKLERTIKGKLTIRNGEPANGKAKFDVKLADHKIKVPSVVGNNIAESMALDVDFNFEKYEKK